MMRFEHIDAQLSFFILFTCVVITFSYNHQIVEIHAVFFICYNGDIISKLLY